MNKYNLWGWAWLIVGHMVTHVLQLHMFGIVANLTAMVFFIISIITEWKKVRNKLRKK